MRIAKHLPGKKRCVGIDRGETVGKHVKYGWCYIMFSRRLIALFVLPSLHVTKFIIDSIFTYIKNYIYYVFVL